LGYPPGQAGGQAGGQTGGRAGGRAGRQAGGRVRVPKKYLLGTVCISVPHRLEARLDYNAKVETLTREAEGSHCTGYAKTATPHTFPFLNF
jgi:hypothetical protein